MKKGRKWSGIILSIVLLFYSFVPVFGDTQIGSLTIHNTKEGEVYRLYKIFDLIYAPAIGPLAEERHAYTIADAFDAFFTEDKVGDFAGDTKDLKAIAYVESRTNDLADFATELQQYVTMNVVAATKAVTGENGTTVVSGLAYGYYLLVPTDALSMDGLSALFSLDTVKPNAEISNKSQYPILEKYILENGISVDANNAAIGDTIQYKTVSTVPNLAGYESYTFYITDTMDVGLSFDDNVEIQLKKGEETKSLIKDVDFVVVQEGQVVTISFENFIQYKSTKWQGADVMITYSATVNENALVGTQGNDNTAILTYSGNPANPSETKSTTPEVVSSFITGVILDKIDGNHNSLAGAAFQIYGDKINKVRVYGNQFVASNTGTYYKLTDGSFTEIVPTAETEAQYASVTQTYAMEYVEESQVQTTSFKVNSFVNAQGRLVLEGLSEGEYVIKEVIAPMGYHKLREPLTITISCKEPNEVIDGTEHCIWSVQLTNPNDENVTPSIENGRILLTVENQTGSELPFTGGMGTVIFTVVGITCMVIALVAVVIVNRKKHSVTEK